LCASDDVDAILSCDGDQVIPTSGAISIHVQQCAAIAEIESGETVENSLLAAPDGESHVKPAVVFFKRDPWADVATKKGGGEEDKETKDIEEGRKMEGRGTDDNRTDAGSTGTFSTSGALDVLLSFNASTNASKCRRGEDKVPGKGAAGCRSDSDTESEVTIPELKPASLLKSMRYRSKFQCSATNVGRYLRQGYRP
jgi:hypothetical protein